MRLNWYSSIRIECTIGRHTLYSYTAAGCSKLKLLTNGTTLVVFQFRCIQSPIVDLKAGHATLEVILTARHSSLHSYQQQASMILFNNETLYRANKFYCDDIRWSTASTKYIHSSNRTIKFCTILSNYNYFQCHHCYAKVQLIKCNSVGNMSINIHKE